MRMKTHLAKLDLLILDELATIPGVGLVWDRGQPTGSKWGGVTADLLVRT